MHSRSPAGDCPPSWRTDPRTEPLLPVPRDVRPDPALCSQLPHPPPQLRNYASCLCALSEEKSVRTPKGRGCGVDTSFTLASEGNAGWVDFSGCWAGRLGEGLTQKSQTTPFTPIQSVFFPPFCVPLECCQLFTGICSSHKMFWPKDRFYQCFCEGKRARTSCPTILLKSSWYLFLKTLDH